MIQARPAIYNRPDSAGPYIDNFDVLNPGADSDAGFFCTRGIDKLGEFP